MFIDATQQEVTVKEYECDSSHSALLLCVGAAGPNVKITTEQGTAILSTLLRMFNVPVQ